MDRMNDLLLRAANGEHTERPPVWLMRQAGRHLPEYREIRSNYGFKEAVTTPEIAAEITLQPWDRYQPDGLVIFSDILVVLDVLGVDYHLESGVGPVIENPIDQPADIPEPVGSVPTVLDYIGDLYSILTDAVGSTVPLIGFAGGPFTLASYLVSGRPTKTHMPVRQFAVEHTDAFHRLLDRLTEIIREHLVFQERAGADLVQLFDTYAGVLSPATYREWLIPRHRNIFRALDCPTINFVRSMNGRLSQLKEAGPDVVSLDWTVDMESARDTLGNHPVQGNLDPATLFGSPESIRQRTSEVIDAAGPQGHILNLGHGVHKNTPVESVSTFIETAKSVSR